MRINLCHRMEPNNSSISKQASLHKKVLEEKAAQIFELGTKTRTPFKFSLLYNLMTGSKVDIISVFCSSWWGFLPAIYATIAGKIRGSKVFINYHGGDFNRFQTFFSILVNPIMQCADFKIVPSHFLDSHFKKLNYDNVFIIPNVLDNDFLSNLNTDKKNIPVFLSTRSLEKEYCIDHSIILFSKIKSKFKRAKFLILGNGKEYHNLKRLANKLGLNRSIFFLGHVPNDKISKLYNISSYSLNSSKIDNAPLSIIESMAASMVTITTKAGEIPLMIRDKFSGILFDLNDLEGSISAISEILLSDKKFNQLRMEARKNFDCNYSFRAAENKINKLYFGDI